MAMGIKVTTDQKGRVLELIILFALSATTPASLVAGEMWEGANLSWQGSIPY